MQLVYFASIREAIGTSEETLAKPDSVNTVADLIAFLKTRDDKYAVALKKTDFIRVAVNQVHVKHDMLLADSDEVAIFPPVTGG